MAVRLSEISKEQKERILNLDENHFVDLKSIEIIPSKLSRHLSAFSNADGGDLFIGINEDKSTAKRIWKGFVNIEAANGFIQCFEELFPLGDRGHGDRFLVPLDRVETEKQFSHSLTGPASQKLAPVSMKTENQTTE